MKHWYKNAIIYELDVETYLDSNGDGSGDFAGLTRAVDYLAGLGVTCVWLLPFFPTPNRDNGYDVQDYYQVDERFGNLGGFVEFLEQARSRNIHVLIDLVVNHSSIDHPWFQAARKSKDSPYRDYYIWVDEPPKDHQEQAVFGKRQGGNWAFDEAAGQYYYHTFYSHEADLNLSNPRVREEIRKIMHFWLNLGVAGFRMDAVPHMLRQKGHVQFDVEPHQILHEFRSYVEEKRSDAVLLAEVDTEPKKYRDYFGDGSQMHMLFNFYLDNYLFLAFARKSAKPITHALKALPRAAKENQYANFLRNHDELDLERLTEDERQEVYQAFGPEENMRIFGRGIRRRLAPILGGDPRRLKLAYSLLLTLPGTPVLRYGDEIGMGENLSLEERNSVRTPMQWSKERNAGFSSAAAEKLIRPVITDGEYSYERVNVNDARRDPDSLLVWLALAVHMRRDCPEFGWGEYRVIDVGEPEVLAHSCTWRGSLAVAVHNLSDRECNIKLELKAAEAKGLLDIFWDQAYEAYDPSAKGLRLGPYGFRWLRTGVLQP